MAIGYPMHLKLFEDVFTCIHVPHTCLMCGTPLQSKVKMDEPDEMKDAAKKIELLFSQG